jgi:flagellar protein FlaG
MEIGSVRPIISGVTAPVPRAPAETKQSVPTELPVRASVTRAEASDGPTAGRDLGRNAADPPLASAGRGQKEATYIREIERDPTTKTIVFKTIEKDSGEVVQQVPEETMLRMRRMVAAWTSDGSNGGRQGIVDVSA